MTPFTRSYVCGLVRSFEDGAYTVLLPGAETVSLALDTVHDGLSLSGEPVEDGHLRPGTTLELCVTEDSEGRRDILPCPSGDTGAAEAGRETAACGRHVREHKGMLSARRSRRAYLAFSDALDIVIGSMKERRGRIYIVLEGQGWVYISFEGPLADGDYSRFLKYTSVRTLLDRVWVLNGRIRRPGCLFYITHMAERDYKSIRMAPQAGGGSSISLSFRFDSAMGSFSMRHVSHILRSYSLDYPDICFFIEQSGHNHADINHSNG